MTNIIDSMISRLHAAGYQTKIWEGRSETRIYVSERGRQLGYLTEYDADGGTGTCKSVRRSGAVSAALRK